MVDVGSGPAIVLIPGIQGRWEWMRPTVDALAAQHRVVTRSLPGEPGSGSDLNAESSFDDLVGHVDGLMDAAHLSKAVICGVSFGGFIALRYAARRGERVRALILVSVPGPRWKPEPHLARYMKWPTLSSPLFALGALRRLWRELRVTLPGPGARLAFCLKAARNWTSAPAIPSRMALRARLAAAERFEIDCAHVSVPTLVVAGERDLDQVVRLDDTLSYVTSIAGAQFRLFEKTGHLGTVSAPDRFAAIVSGFLNGLA
jgi:3-oxoadipate enol-lactonase